MKPIPILFLSLLLLLLCSTTTVLATDDGEGVAEYEFSVSGGSRKKTLRHRLAVAASSTRDEQQQILAGLAARPGKASKNNAAKSEAKQQPSSTKEADGEKAATTMTEEDKLFWERLLADDVGSMPDTGTEAPGCPTRIQVDCVTVDGGNPCTSVVPPASGTGDDCVVEVEFIYTITNNGNEMERIYSVQVTRGMESIVVTDIPDAIPTVDLAPGDVVVAPVLREIDVCTELGIAAFDTVATVLTGPPSSVSVTIFCESEEGEECQEISQAPTTDDCLLNVTYTYEVENTGVANFNIFQFERTRDGEYADLMPLLQTFFLATGETTSVQETEEIDRCVSQTFYTQVKVRKIPSPDLLCSDRATYP